jgi:hypothetical protein
MPLTSTELSRVRRSFSELTFPFYVRINVDYTTLRLQRLPLMCLTIFTFQWVFILNLKRGV